MSDCTTPNATATMRTYIDNADHVVKATLFTSILAGRYIIPNITGRSMNRLFYQRIHKTLLARDMLLSMFVVPDLLDCYNGSMTSGKNWKALKRNQSLFITDITTTLGLMISLKWIKAPHLTRLLTQVCLTSWVIGSTLSWAVAREDGDQTSQQETAAFFHLLFAASSSVWSARSTPVALTGALSGILGILCAFERK